LGCNPEQSLAFVELRSETLQERAMKQTTVQKAWKKPQINRLGQIRDVAGPNNTGSQGGKS